MAVSTTRFSRKCALRRISGREIESQVAGQNYRSTGVMALPLNAANLKTLKKSSTCQVQARWHHSC